MDSNKSSMSVCFTPHAALRYWRCRAAMHSSEFSARAPVHLQGASQSFYNPVADVLPMKIKPPVIDAVSAVDMKKAIKLFKKLRFDPPSAKPAAPRRACAGSQWPR